MTALEQFNTIMETETIDEPIERLRFFLSLALTGQDWLDVEQFIDGVSQQLASRDAEIAELVGVLGNVTAHLVAAHSLLSRGGKKAAASDTVFKIMLQDYEKSFEAGRKALVKVRKP